MAFNTSNPIITRQGSLAVIYDLSKPYQTTITLPVGSSWTSGLHWHETHDEYLHVLQGSIRVRLGSSTHILHVGQQAKVSRFWRHEWSRADVSTGEEVIVLERTEPADDEKHLFFWNLNGVILSSKGERWWSEWLIMLRLFMIFYTLDNWPVLCEMSYVRRSASGVLAAKIESWITRVVLASAVLLGGLLGLEAVDTRLTPPELMCRWQEKQRLKQT